MVEKEKIANRRECEISVPNKEVSMKLSATTTTCAYCSQLPFGSCVTRMYPMHRFTITSKTGSKINVACAVADLEQRMLEAQAAIPIQYGK